MKTSFTILLQIIICTFLQAQDQKSFRWPVDPPFMITGNYGELRPNHFHAGLDFSTRNQMNIPVFAAGDAYVSRVRQNSTGYGKCVYLTHANGLVTVYAHLNVFADRIEKHIEAEMRRQKVNELDLYLEKNLIRLKKGELLGLSGNSGGSTGPHLHFEFRDEKTEIPLNPLKILPMRDTIKPLISHIAFYDLSDSLAPKLEKSVIVTGKTQMVIVDLSVFGIAIDASDQMTPGSNANNVYAADIYVDDQLFYTHHLDQIDFADGRYVNEYSERKGRQKFQKCFLPVNYPARFDVSANNRGRLAFSDSLFHSIRIKVTDEAGNKTETVLLVRSNGRTDYKMIKRKGTLIDCRQDEVLCENAACLKLPARCLYSPAVMLVAVRGNSVTILPEELNMHMAAELSLPAPPAYKRFQEKLILKSKNIIYPAVVRNDSVCFSIKNTGFFEIKADSLPPVVKAVHARSRRSNFQAFKLSDKLSGIQSYHIFINDEWVLCEYDAKSETLFYRFKPNSPKGLLKFRVEASDRCGNQTKFHWLLNRD